MERPQSKYVKAVDGVSIGYQVFGQGPYDLVLNDGWMGNIDANRDIDEVAELQRFMAQRSNRGMEPKRRESVLLSPPRI